MLKLEIPGQLPSGGKYTKGHSELEVEPCAEWEMERVFGLISERSEVARKNPAIGRRVATTQGPSLENLPILGPQWA